MRITPRTRGHWRTGRVKDFQSACRRPFIFVRRPDTRGVS